MKYGKFLPNPSTTNSIFDESSSRRFTVIVVRPGKKALAYKDLSGDKALNLMHDMKKRGFNTIAETGKGDLLEQLTLTELQDIIEWPNPGDFVHVRIRSTGREVLSQKFPDERLHPFKQRVADDNGVKVSDVEIIKGSTTIRGNGYLERLTVAELHELIATVQDKIDKIVDERSRYDQTTGRGAMMVKKLTGEANALQRDLVGYRKILAAKSRENPQYPLYYPDTDREIKIGDTVLMKKGLAIVTGIDEQYRKVSLKETKPSDRHKLIVGEYSIYSIQFRSRAK